MSAYIFYDASSMPLKLIYEASFEICARKTPFKEVSLESYYNNNKETTRLKLRIYY